MSYQNKVTSFSKAVSAISLLSILGLFVAESDAVNQQQEVPRTSFFVTIDVETSAGCDESECNPISINDRILGKRGNDYYGIPLIMDILEQHGMKGTFFVNAYLDSYHPETEIKSFVQQIIDRGHDVQLHTHEEFRCLAICSSNSVDCWNRCSVEESFLAGNTLENQTAIISEGARNIERWSGKYPVAYRAGSYAADFNTLKALQTLDIPIDSSSNGPDHVFASKLPINRIGEYGGIVEVPLFNYTEDIIFRKSIRFFDIESTTLLEARHLLDEAVKHDLRSVLLMMHSFSFCRAEFGCPINSNIERFDQLLAHINTLPEVQATTFREFWDRYQSDPEAFTGGNHMPTTTYFHTLHRSFVRFDQGIRNKIFALSNVALITILMLIIVVSGRIWAISGRTRRGTDKPTIKSTRSPR